MIPELHGSGDEARVADFRAMFGPNGRSAIVLHLVAYELLAHHIARALQHAEVDAGQILANNTEGEELRSRANEKFGSVQEGLAQAERELKQEHQKVQRLEASLEIAGKVTGMGKLVSLSRESLEREWRIVDSKLRSSADASAEDLEEEYERATRILEVQGQVANERAAIERLQRNHQESSEPRAQMRTPQRRPR